MRRQSRGELRRLRKLAEIRVQDKKREKIRKQSLIHLLAIGEGTERGPAYKRAQRAQQMKRRVNIVAVDVRRPNYTPPENMKFLVAGALKYLETVPPCTVKRITDYAAFEVITMEEYGKTTEGEQEFTRIASEALHGKLQPPGFPNLKKNAYKYARLAMRALVPGGRFTIVTLERCTNIIRDELKRTGFKVTSELVTREKAVRIGSRQAVHDIDSGEKVSKLVAIKPRSG